MSFQDELEATARGLAQLAARGTSELAGTELDVALYARATVLDLAAEVQRAMTGRAGWGGSQHLADLEVDPVASLQKALRAHPRVRGRSAPSDVLATDPPSTAGWLWKDVARHALQAQHLWQTGTLTRPDPDVAWAAVADVAALASVVVELDVDLAAAAHALPGRRLQADRLARAVTSGLRTAAREVLALADSGPMPARGPEPTPAPRREIVPVVSAQQAVAAQEQLAVLLRSAHHLRPERVALITLGHSRTLGAVLETWRQTGAPVDAELRREVVHHRQLLVQACGRRWGTASLDGGDPYPLHQAQILRSVLQSDRPELRRLLADPLLTRRFVTALADTSAALSEVTDAHLKSGAWLRPTTDDGRLWWAPTRSWRDVPHATQALRAAGIHAQQLRIATTPVAEAFERLVGRPAPGHRPTLLPRATGVRHALPPQTAAPLPARFAVQRPARPSVPPRPVAPSHVEKGIRR